jgi:hypothetical protein
VDGARDVPLVPLVLLADVDEERSVELARANDVDLVDLGAELGQKVAVAGHDYPEYSDGAPG